MLECAEDVKDVVVELNIDFIHSSALLYTLTTSIPIFLRSQNPKSKSEAKNKAARNSDHLLSSVFTTMILHSKNIS